MTPTRFVLALVITAFMAAPAAAEKRHALVVGIDHYQALPKLQNAVNDAAAVARSLETIGFSVTRADDADRRGIVERLAAFTKAIEPGDIAFLFFSGQGIQVDNVDWLIPADQPRSTEVAAIRLHSLALHRVVEEVMAAKPRALIAVVDACRDNPFAVATARGPGHRGLAPGAGGGGPGYFLLYSAGAGQVALDALSTGDGIANSVFTRIFAPLLADKSLTIQEIASRTQGEVARLAAATGVAQTPAYYDQLLGPFRLAP